MSVARSGVGSDTWTVTSCAAGCHRSHSVTRTRAASLATPACTAPTSVVASRNERVGYSVATSRFATWRFVTKPWLPPRQPRPRQCQRRSQYPVVGLVAQRPRESFRYPTNHLDFHETPLRAPPRRGSPSHFTPSAITAATRSSYVDRYSQPPPSPIWNTDSFPLGCPITA